MTDEDFGPFVDRLVVVAELFGASLSTAAQLLYFQSLKDLDAAAVDQALANCVQACTFMPKPAEIRSRTGNAAGDLELVVEEAWLEYKRQARAVGAYNSPTLNATLADTLLAIFDTWEKACWTELSPEMWAAKRKEFGRVYRLMQERGHTGTKTLNGFCARSNDARFGLARVLEALPAGAGDPKLLRSSLAAEASILDDRQEQRRRREQREEITRAIEDLDAIRAGREAKFIDATLADAVAGVDAAVGTDRARARGQAARRPPKNGTSASRSGIGGRLDRDGSEHRAGPGE